MGACKLPLAPCVQERTRAHDIASITHRPAALFKWGKDSIHRLSAVTLHPAQSVHADRGSVHRLLRSTTLPRALHRAGKGMGTPAVRHIQSGRLLRGLCENSIQLFSRGSLASSGKDHFHNWKEQSCLSVRMDTSPSENLNFSAQLSIQERTRQAMCSVPASKWYNGIAS